MQLELNCPDGICEIPSVRGAQVHCIDAQCRKWCTCLVLDAKSQAQASFVPKSLADHTQRAKFGDIARASRGKWRPYTASRDRQQSPRSRFACFSHVQRCVAGLAGSSSEVFGTRFILKAIEP